MSSWLDNKDLLFYDSRQNVAQRVAFPEKEPEMTEFESAFLCGLIREKKPKKIVEVGVAAGGTTAIVLETLSLLGMNETTEVFSVDCSELFYRGKGEKSGYLAEDYKRNTDWRGNHKMILGKFLPEVLEEIGNDIDFLILDTVHCLPGEFMDYLAVFPYLKPHALVVLHDIALHHYELPYQIATQLLMDTVVADKCLVKDVGRNQEYPNIGAFEINDDTSKYMADVFHALTITWNYIPERRVFDLYLQSYEKNYPLELVKVAESAYELQCVTHRNNRSRNLEEWQSSKSYRIGRMITFIPRKIKRLINSAKQG